MTRYCKPRFWLWLVLSGLVLAGCSRQDNDALARIGRKLAERADNLAAECKDYLNLDWTGQQSLETRITQRLRWDKSLADLAIDIKVSGKDVEVCGIVADPQLKRRAVELVETTVGVDKVIDNLQLFAGPAAPTPVPAKTP